MQCNKILMVSLIIFSAIAHGCAPDGEKNFVSGAELYNSGRTGEAINKFEEGMLCFSAKKSLSHDKILNCDNALYVRKAGAIKIIYPKKIKFDITGDYSVISFDPAFNRTALTNGADIRIFDSEGAPVKIISPVENTNKNIKSLVLDNNFIIYYISGIIYRCNMDTGEAKTVTGHKFECPFSDAFYSVRFYLSGKRLAVAAGLGGSYNLSVIDLEKNTAVIKNMEIAASKLFFSGDDIYFISGKSGNWALNHLAAATNSNRIISSLTDITDVEFSDACILYENSLGIWFLDYAAGQPERLPFNYELAGGCGGFPLLKFKGDSYVCDMKVFRDKLTGLKNSAPQIFIQEKESPAI